MVYSQFLLKDIYWSFTEKYTSISSFVSSLQAYNEKLENDKIFLPEQIILRTNKVVIQYSYWDGEEGDDVEPDFDLTADNNTFFTAAELLFKVNNKVVDDLKNSDNHFFEGFQLWEGENPNSPDVPLYFIVQGS